MTHAPKPPPCGFGIATGQLIGPGLPMLEAVREGLSKAVSASLAEKESWPT